MKKLMHQYAKPSTFGNAKYLRYNQLTDAEKKLWEAIRGKKLGVKFRQQHPISVYILDFYCHEVKLVIELDGGYHNDPNQKRYDANRTQFLNEIGLNEMRFKNEEVLNNLDKVVERIEHYLKDYQSKYI